MRLTIHTRHRRLLITTGDDYNDPDDTEPPNVITNTAGEFTPAPEPQPETSPEWEDDKHIGFTPPRIPREKRAHHIRQATDRMTNTLNDTKDQP